jgi:hypothetical protein
MSRHKTKPRRIPFLKGIADSNLRKLERDLEFAFRHLGTDSEPEIALRLWWHERNSTNRKLIEQAITSRVNCDQAFAGRLQMRIALARPWEILPKIVFMPRQS